MEFDADDVAVVGVAVSVPVVSSELRWVCHRRLVFPDGLDF